jgi:hypothetical protein
MTQDIFLEYHFNQQNLHIIYFLNLLMKDIKLLNKPP